MSTNNCPVAAGRTIASSVSFGEGIPRLPQQVGSSVPEITSFEQSRRLVFPVLLFVVLDHGEKCAHRVALTAIAMLEKYEGTLQGNELYGMHAL